MARPRLPAGKAEASGAALINPARFKDRTAPKKVRPLGEPYLTMTDQQKIVWHEMAGDMPWLNSSHRILVRLACYHAARLEEGGEFGVSATQALSSILSKLGATPVDETKVNHDAGDAEDPEDKFFGRPN
jgi:hypothetical protein